MLAALNLALCTGYEGYRLVVAAGSQVAGSGQGLRRTSEADRKDLARIPALDPDGDFAELARLVDREDRAVREAALARLRSHHDFVASLAAELTTGSVSSGSVDRALALTGIATFSPEEQKLLALPARTAIERITRSVRSELWHFTEDRRKGMRRWGSEVFRAVAAGR